MVVAHNIHENVGKIQEGGTSLLAFGHLIQYVDLTAGKDVTGFERWVLLTLRGERGFVTRIMCSYNPCGNVKPHFGIVYQQHPQFFITTQQSMMK